MGKVEILSPVHIGTGKTYYSFTIHGNKRYSFEAMLNTVNNKESLLNEANLIRLTNNKLASRMSNREFYRTFNINQFKLHPKDAMYSLKVFTTRDNQVHENVKSGGNLYIPGSSLKGYILNVVWYDIVRKNDNIKTLLLNKGNARINNPFKFIEDYVKDLYQFLNVRDIMFSLNEPSLYQCDRIGFYNKKRRSETKIPAGLVECIGEKAKVECEIIYGNDSAFLASKKPIKDGILESIKLNNRINDVDKPIIELLFNEIYKRITNLKDWFKEANKDFLLANIADEIKFIDEVDNKGIDKDSIISFYTEIKARLNKGEIIIRLGRFTNYQEKSIGLSFGRDYEFRFLDFFFPHKNKKVPGIRTMNIFMDINKSYNIIPGYMRIEF